MSPLLKQEIDNNAKGKNWDSLAKSRKLRDSLVTEWGYYEKDGDKKSYKVPSSILVRDASDKAMDPIADNSYANSGQLVRQGETRRERLSAFGVSSQGCAEGGLSKFPQNIGRLLIRFYCPKGGTVYDPFAGHSSRLQLAYTCERNYVGVDICERFMDANRLTRRKLLAENKISLHKNNSTITLIEGSSAKVDLPDNYADFTVTSPPYWDIETYGPEPEQLGNAKTYKSFLHHITPHIEENFRILKPETYCCWCINDFKKDKHYYSYHSDLIPIFLNAGFNLHTIYIVDLAGSPLQASFVQSILSSMAFPKRHEYCLVFHKPRASECKPKEKVNYQRSK
jgi:DNA modification methylase